MARKIRRPFKGVNIKEIFTSDPSMKERLRHPATPITRAMIFVHNADHARQIASGLYARLPGLSMALRERPFPTLSLGVGGVEVWQVMIWCAEDLGRDAARGWAFDHVFILVDPPEVLLNFYRLEAMKLRESPDRKPAFHWYASEEHIAEKLRR